jgi:ribonuclease HII
MSRGTLDIARVFPGLDDSKKLSPARREVIFKQVQTSGVRYAVAYGLVEEIETFGITRAIRTALNTCLKELAPPRSAFVYLDGLLHAPHRYAQETVIHGDALVPVISLASVIAKVSRDAHMCELAKEYPAYGFEKHKGYGTAEHIAALRELGPVRVHRKSFLTRILGVPAIG